MNLQPALHKTLLAGTARAPLDATGAVAPALQGMLAGVPADSLVWQAVAADDLWQRAGALPVQAPAQPPCEPQPTCPRAAEQVLGLILRDIHPELLEHWLATAARMGFLVPHACLVPLLDKVTPRHALQAQVAALMGKRGQWLAAHNPSWTAVRASAPDDAGALWQTGDLQQRRHALSAMRRADPAAALAALEQEWPQEPAENRIALLPCLSNGLNLNDEAFLERALDDKRKEVRQSAQLLLAALPGTAFEQRAAARLASLLTVEKKSGFGARLGAMLGGAQPATLHIALPETRDAAMQRDGIGIDKHPGMGEKAGWLLDMVQQVSPRHWSGAWEMTPAQVIDTMAASEFKVAMVTALVRAAARMIAHDASAEAHDWFVTLMTEADPKRTEVYAVQMLMPQMVHLPPALQEQILAHWIERQAYGHAVNRAATQTDALSAPLSRALLTTVQRDLAALTTHDYNMRAIIKSLGRVLNADDTAYAQANWPGADWPHWPHYRDAVDEMMETLQFRHTMQRSFLESKA